MKISEENIEILKENTLESRPFQVSPENLAFAIRLVADQYKNPLKTVLTEYVQNAIDSHRSAGKSDVPIKITLPNKLNPYYKVRDEGVSMEPDEIMNILSDVFGSTKRNSDDDIGGFGVGRLVFSAYTGVATFTVFNHGKRFEFLLHLIDGKGDITKLGEADSDEPKGVEVKIPVRPEDFEECYTLCRKLYEFITPLPIIYGISDFNLTEAKYKFSFDNVGFRCNHKPAIVTIAGLPYPLDSDKFTYDSHYSKLLNDRFSIVLKFNVKDLDVTPNRDSLKYTDKTIKNIKTRLDEVVKVLEDNFNKTISEIKTKYEARIFLSSFWSKESAEKLYWIIKTNSYSYYDCPTVMLPDGQKIRSYTADIPQRIVGKYGPPVFLFYRVYKEHGKIVKNGYLGFEYSTNKYLFVPADYSQYRLNKALRYYIENKHSKISLIVSSYSDYTIKDFVRDMSLPADAVEHIDDIEVPVAPKTAVDRPKLSDVYILNLHTWRPVAELDKIADDGVYLSINRRTMQKFYFDDKLFSNAAIKDYRRCINQDVKIYGVPKAKIKKLLKECPTLKSFEDIIKQKVGNQLETLYTKISNNLEDYPNYLYVKSICNRINYFNVFTLFDGIVDDSNVLKVGIKKYITDFTDTISTELDEYNNLVKIFSNCFEKYKIIDEPAIKQKSKLDIAEKFEEYYPNAYHVSSGRFFSKHYQSQDTNVLHYINLMDELRNLREFKEMILTKQQNPI